MSTEEIKQPNPGSNEALDLGCTCPVLDNGHGNNRFGKERGFWINSDCPLHSINLTKSLVEEIKW